MEGDIVLPQGGRTEVIFDVFVADPLVIDQYVYRCWLQGLDGIKTFHSHFYIPEFTPTFYILFTLYQLN
jgi:hypothetical protein